MNKKIKVCYRIAFDNGKEIYMSIPDGFTSPVRSWKPSIPV